MSKSTALRGLGILVGIAVASLVLYVVGKVLGMHNWESFVSQMTITAILGLTLAAIVYISFLYIRKRM